jgi:hypothetical protein
MGRQVSFPGDMRMEVQLCPEGAGRLIKVAVWSLADTGAAPKPGARWRARDAVPLFVQGVEVGLFMGPREDERAEVIDAQASDTGGERLDTWEIRTPRLAVEAFAVLGRMFWTAGAREVAIFENAPEARRTVRGFEAPPPIVRAVPWEVDKRLREDAKDAVVTVCFERAPAPELVRATHALFRAWSAVAGFGGFTGPALPTSSAVLAEVGSELETEVFAAFDGLQIRRDAWAALWEGLLRIHRHAPIERVVMR